MYSLTILKDIVDIQTKYEKLAKTNLTKKTLCELVIPFRDKYCLKDKEALSIARNELSLKEITCLIENIMSSNNI